MVPVDFGQAYLVELVSLASGDLCPVPDIVLKWPRQLGKSGYNKQGIGEHKHKSVKMEALTEKTLSVFLPTLSLFPLCM